MSIDFDWGEGDDGFSSGAQPSPARPARTPRSFDPSTPAPQQGVSNLTLLIVGIALGMAIGLVVVLVQGQRSALKDVAPVLQVQYRALTQRDPELLTSILASGNDAWRGRYLHNAGQLALLYAADAAEPRARRVNMQGDLAEVESEFSFDGESYRRLDAMQRSAEGWVLTQGRLTDGGELQVLEGEHVTLRFRERDAFIADLLPSIDTIASTFCERYGVQPPCRVDLTIDAEPDLLPFVPGDGANLPPLVTRYHVTGTGDTHMITLNGAGDELDDAAVQRALFRSLPQLASLDDLHLTRSANPEAVAIAAERLRGDAIPVAMPSPRWVGVAGETPHPLWQLALHEAIGDAVMRRAVGPITAPDDAAFALWAIARGDVARMAEQMSGVTLDDAAGDTALAPALIGAALADGDIGARNQARELARFVLAEYGEAATLTLLRNAHHAFDPAELFAPLDITPETLAQVWLNRSR